jgi:hypothetical protein
MAGHDSQYYSSPPHCTSIFSKKVSKIVRQIGFLIPLNGKNVADYALIARNSPVREKSLQFRHPDYSGQQVTACKKYG